MGETTRWAKVEARLTDAQVKRMAEIIAARLYEATDELWSLEELTRRTGWSKSYVYHNVEKLGGMKAGGKLFFSRQKIEELIKLGIR